ncbi:DUF3592 domain-containing protein [Eubacteriales bacterium OttesenSCG-928-M02]|nr:DUF3592 domain-containing protein [Eubacteriales bacterium OttesenSCG-928-M02]
MENKATFTQQLAMQMTSKSTRIVFLLIIATFLIVGIVVIFNSVNTILHLSNTKGQWETVKGEVSNVTYGRRRSSGTSKTQMEYRFQLHYSYDGQQYSKNMESSKARSEGQIIDVYVNRMDPTEVRQDISGLPSIFISIAGLLSAALGLFLFILYLKAAAYRRAYARQSIE